MNLVKKIKAYLCYREAVKKAEQAHKKTGERYYVIPASDETKTLLIVDRKNFRILKRKGYIPQRANVLDLERECFYATQHRNGSSKLSKQYVEMKKKQYYYWYGRKIQRKK